jgi:ABC-type oligopeptide transport system ATPase subunit
VSAVVAVRGLHKTFTQAGPWPWSPAREIPAVQGVDFEVAEGEVVALVGQSGSGKTTVSRIVLGLEEPTAGEIWLDGKRWDGLTEAERRPQRVRYQYVPQDALGALDETDVWDRVEEAANVGEDSVLMGVGPELAGHLELLIDVDRLGDLDGAVGLLRGVVQFA